MRRPQHARAVSLVLTFVIALSSLTVSESLGRTPSPADEPSASPLPSPVATPSTTPSPAPTPTPSAPTQPSPSAAPTGPGQPAGRNQVNPTTKDAAPLSLEALGAGAFIDNGTIQLGVNPEGELNVFDGPPSSTGVTTVGLRYLPNNTEAISPGCECKGWGGLSP